MPRRSGFDSLHFGTQLLLVLGLALGLAHLAMLLLWWHLHGGLHPIARDQALSRLGAAYRLAEVARPERIEFLLGAAQTDEAQFQVQLQPTLPAGALTPAERELRQALGQRLALPEDPLRVHLGPVHTLDDAGHPTLPGWWPGQPPMGLRVSLPLSDGRWFNGRVGPLEAPGLAPRDAAWLIAGEGLLLTLLTVLALRRVLRPWDALVDTVQRFGRGERPPPLPLAGPRELRELTARFNELQARVSRFVEERTRLLAAISHDLRTPLTALRLRAEMVDDAALRAAMQRTLAELQSLVEQTLEFASTDAQVEAPQALDLAALCTHIAEERRAVGHQLTLETPAKLPWLGRPLALQRAVGNLVDNALQHGGATTLRLRLGLDGQALIEIDDEGPGIAPELLGQVMAPYFRADSSRSRRAGGAGLGLAIAQAAVLAHGGTLVLHNRAGGGLRATITLPPAPRGGVTVTA